MMQCVVTGCSFNGVALFCSLQGPDSVINCPVGEKLGNGASLAARLMNFSLSNIVVLLLQF